MKKNLVLIALSICFAFSSCSTEESVVSQKDNLDVKINTVRLSDIPLIKEELSKIKLEKVKHRNALARSIDDFNLNEDKIIALEKDNYSSYTFIVEQPIEEANAYIVENLVIETIGTSYNAYIVKYIPNDGNPFYNIQDFNGSIKYETLDGDTVVDIPINTTMSEDSFPTDEYTVTIGNWSYVLIYAGGSWSVGSATYTGGNNSSGGTGGNNTGGNSGNNSSGNGYHNGGGGSNNYGNPGSGGSSSTVPNIPTNDEVLAKKYTAFLNNLSPQQYQFLATNNNVNNAIFNYLEEGFFSVTRKEFATQFIQNSITSGLNLDFEKSLNSPANIDFSAIDTTTPEGQKLDCIYQKLMQSPSFKNLFSDIFGNNDRVNVKFGIKNSSELVDNQGNPVLGQTNTVSIQNGVININVNINQQFLLNQSPLNYGSNVYIAKVIAHECLHAYLQYIRIHDVNFPNITIPNLNNQTIAQLITSYVDQYHGGYEHNFIANELLPHLANVLNEIKNLTLSSSDISNLGNLTVDLPNAGLNNEAFNWNDFFKSLALQGLEKTNYFSNNYHTFNGNNPLSVIQYSNISNSGRYFFYNGKAKNTTTNCN